jgi:hypothetical protein
LNLSAVSISIYPLTPVKNDVFARLQIRIFIALMFRACLLTTGTIEGAASTLFYPGYDVSA